MSTYYRIVGKDDVKLEDFKNWLEQSKYDTAIDQEERISGFAIVDETDNYLWVHPNDDGRVRSFTRYLGNNVDSIIEKIEEEFGLDIIDEHNKAF